MIYPQVRLPHPYDISPAAAKAQTTADQALAIAQAAVKSAFGQIADQTAQAQVVNGGWTPILNYDTRIPNSVGIVESLINGTLSVTEPGVYMVHMAIDLSFTPNNAGRQTFIRVFNVTDNLSTTQVRVDIGRDAEGAQYTAAILTSVSVPFKAFRLEIGNGDTLTNVSRLGVTYGIHRVSA